MCSSGKHLRRCTQVTEQGELGPVTSSMSSLCYDMHDNWPVTITAMGEHFSHKPLLCGPGKSPSLFTGVEEKRRVSTS